MNSAVPVSNGPMMITKSRRRFALPAVLLIFTAFASVAGAQNETGANNDPVPAIVQPLVPGVVTPGAGAFTLQVNGTGFTTSSVVNWNGTPLATTFVSSDKLQAAVTASKVQAVGTAAITVTNPDLKVSGKVFLPINSAIPAVNFTSVSYPTGSQPTGVAVTDVNNDGILDLVVCNDFDQTISVLLGKPDGTFQPQTTLPAFGFPYNVFVGDFNNDGIPDLVTVDEHAAAISVFLGLGDGKFGVPQNYATTGAIPVGMAIGDFNGDGNLDVATANSGASTLSVFLGKGDGTFQKAVNYFPGSVPNDIAVGDFNGDGIPDLAIADNASGYAAILIGNGDGTFQPKMGSLTGKGPNAIHVADLNKDGILDIVTANASGTVSVLLGNGDGTFQTHQDLPAGSYPSYSIATYDFNNDGNVDIIVPELNDGTLSIYLGNGDGTFQPPTSFPVLTHPDALTVADFNNDGRLDLAVADETADMVTVVTQLPPSFTVNPQAMAFGNVQLGMQSKSQTSTVTNNSSLPVTISSITESGRNYIFFPETNTCPSSLRAGASCTITVTFTPRTVGAKTATVNITDSAGMQSIALSGTGVR